MAAMRQAGVRDAVQRRSTVLLEVPKPAFPAADGVAVETSEFVAGQLGVIARRRYERGDLIYTVRGPISSVRTPYTFQCGPEDHIDPVEEDGVFGFGHYTNHSCNPNAYVQVVGRGAARFIEVRARRRIHRGQEVSLDYGAMEYEMAHGVECLCGARECRGRLVGFKDLPRELKPRYRLEGIVPAYLFELDRA